MPVLPRVLAPDLDSAQGRVRLASDESAHLTRVLRLGPGDRVLVFDGRGRQHAAEIAAATKQAVTLSVLEPVPAAPEPRCALTLAQAVLKGDKMDAIVRDATMMGVAALVPLVTDRTVVPRSAVDQGRLAERWRRVAVASAKQCGRAVVPVIEPARRFEALFTPGRPESLLLQLVEPAAGPSVEDGARFELPVEPPASVLLAIGPEGGWSPEEVAAAARAGCRAWTLGARTLRAESAPLAALSVLTYVWSL